MDKENLGQPLDLLEIWNNLPFPKFLGYEVKSCAEGRCIIELPVNPNVIGPFNVVHGGVFYSLCEVSTFLAAATVLPGDKVSVTNDINISVLKFVSGGTLLVEAWVLKSGKRSCFVEARITDDSGQPVAVARASKMIISKPSPS